MNLSCFGNFPYYRNRKWSIKTWCVRKYFTKIWSQIRRPSLLLRSMKAYSQTDIWKMTTQCTALFLLTWTFFKLKFLFNPRRLWYCNFQPFSFFRSWFHKFLKCFVFVFASKFEVIAVLLLNRINVSWTSGGFFLLFWHHQNPRASSVNKLSNLNPSLEHKLIL